jgi:hypothetical protein
MNARKLTKIQFGLTATAIALFGALAMSASCGSSSTSNGGSGGNGGGGSGGGGNGGGGSGGGGSGGSTSSGTCTDPGADAVNFCHGKAQGVMAGYAYIALGKLDTATDPKCAPDSKDTNTTQDITKDTPCPTTGTTVWNAADALCITGDIPAVTGGDYTSNWGLQIGVNTIDPPATASGSGTLNKTYASITVTTTGTITPTNTAIRVVLHTVGMAADANPYCATMQASGKAISLDAFNTECWGPSTAAKYLTKDDKVADIDKVGVQISSDTSNEYKVNNFCVTGFQFGN